MSSPLDGRIRVIAREELQAAMGAAHADNADENRGTVQEQIDDLHGHLHELRTQIVKLHGRLSSVEALSAPRRGRQKPAADE